MKRHVLYRRLSFPRPEKLNGRWPATLKRTREIKGFRSTGPFGGVDFSMTSHTTVFRGMCSVSVPYTLVRHSGQENTEAAQASPVSPLSRAQ